MVSSKGQVESIAASGRIWAGFEAEEVKTLFFDSLKKAKKSIQISIFSLGEDNDEMNEFFEIIQNKIDAKKQVQFLVNDIDGSSIGTYSKKILNKLKKYENFDLHNFKPEKKSDLLHAKVVVIDRTFALVGSANISKNALFSNYEIMLKITGSAAGIIANMLDRLAEAIKNGEQL